MIADDGVDDDGDSVCDDKDYDCVLITEVHW